MIVALLTLFVGNAVLAQEFSGTNFKVLDPVMNSGSYSASSNYQLNSSISQLGIGISSTATYGGKAGFLYYPFVTTPVLSGSAGDTEVTLSWTAASGFLGWNVSGYKIAQATASGGPYTYSSSVGNVLTSTRTGLTNGINYYFLVLPLDAFGNTIATSSEITLQPVASGTTPPSGGGGGGGQIGNEISFSGLGYPNSRVYLLQDAVMRESQVANSSGEFTIKLKGLPSALYLFSLYAEDKNGERSPLRLVPVKVENSATTLSGLLLAPTLVADKDAVKQGDTIIFSGYSAKSAIVSIFLGDDARLLSTVNADQKGYYEYKLSTASFAKGDFIVRTKTSFDNTTSPSSVRLIFNVGDVTKEHENKLCRYADLNCDGKINLIDFSILLYWVDHTPIPSHVDLNSDGEIDLKDFSILIFYWTG